MRVHEMEHEYPIYHKKNFTRILKSYKDVPGWLNDTDWIYKEVVDKFDDGAHFVEIGTLLGQSACRMGELIRDSGKDIKFDSIDTFYRILHGIQNGEHPESFKKYINLYEKQDIMHILDCHTRALNVNDYINFICCDSRYAHYIYEDNSLDFVWIDGSHDEEIVKSDINNYWKKIKPGGILAGDDYVYSAVNDSVNMLVKLHHDEIDDFVSSSYGSPTGMNETAEDRFNFFKITKIVGGGTPLDID